MAYTVGMTSDAMTHTYQVSRRSVQEFRQYYGYYRNNLRGCSVGITDERNFLNTVELASGGMIYITSLMTVGTRIRVILRLLPQHSERL
jgi:hypothetical protein